MVLLVTLGSGGDVHPFIAIGQELQARGVPVMLVTNPYFERAVTSAGVPFSPLGTTEEYQQAIAHPDLVHANRSTFHVLEHLVFRQCKPMYVATRRLARQLGAKLIVRHHIAFAAGWAAEREAIADVSCVLAPVFWLNPASPAVFGSIPFALPTPLAKLRIAVSTIAARWIIDGPCNKVRAELELPPRFKQFSTNAHAGAVNLGLWSSALRGPMPGDEPNGRITGPCVVREQGEGVVPEPVERFLAAGDGDPSLRPICFTLGTSVAHHAGEFYAMAASICRKLGQRGLFLLGPKADAIAGAADWLRRDERLCIAGYVPYGHVLPRCRAVVHHGGVGTVHACLAAGVPQVVVAFANDEFDNGARVVKLGVGSTVRASRMTQRRLLACLATALEPNCHARASEVARHGDLQPGAGAASACDALLAVMTAK